MDSSNKPAEWVSLAPLPTVPGWYAIAYSWDADEGVFVGSAQWGRGEACWDVDLPVIAWAGPFADERAAEVWADLHDVWAWRA